MVILGGVGSLHGAIIGAGAFLLLEEWLPSLLRMLHPAFAEHWKVVFGPLLVLIVLFMRGGIMGLITRITGGKIG
jgi:branched-chain amino acid transport system permease protein